MSYKISWWQRLLSTTLVRVLWFPPALNYDEGQSRVTWKSCWILHTWSDWLPFKKKKRGQISIWLRTTFESGPNVDWKDQIPCHPLPPLGPEDVLHFAFQDLTFKHKKPVYHPVIGYYKPAEHHPVPVRWLCHSAPTEPDQFSDADMWEGFYVRESVQVKVQIAYLTGSSALTSRPLSCRLFSLFGVCSDFSREHLFSLV